MSKTQNAQSSKGPKNRDQVRPSDLQYMLISNNRVKKTHGNTDIGKELKTSKGWGLRYWKCRSVEGLEVRINRQQ